MPLDQAKRVLGPRPWADVRYLHLSSYFLVLRRPVLDDPGFRFRLDHVRGQRDKMLVVDKYEWASAATSWTPGSTSTPGPTRCTRSTRSTRAACSTWSRAASPWSSATTWGRTPARARLRRLAEGCSAVAPGRAVDMIRASIERVSPDDRVQRGLLASRRRATASGYGPRPPGRASA